MSGDTLFAKPALPVDGPLPAAPDARIEQAVRTAGLGPPAGTDEAGRGCLAGPVIAAAVIFPEHVRIRTLDDSKALSAEAREALLPEIEHTAITWAVGVSSPAEIDRWNILHASLLAMRRAVEGLETRPGFVLVDGNRTIPSLGIGQHAVVKGDARSISVAAASIIAKVTRDRLMRGLAEQYPGYGWDRNMGYPTPDHFEGLKRLGPSPAHRMSFRLRLEEPRQPGLFPS